MSSRTALWSGLVAVLFLMIGGAWMLSLPAAPAIGERPPALALDHAPQKIADHYGVRTADFVAMQLEPRFSVSELNIIEVYGLP